MKVREPPPISFSYCKAGAGRRPRPSRQVRSNAAAMAVVAPNSKLPEIRVVTSLRLPPELMIGLKSLAMRKLKPVNDVIVEAIKHHLTLRQ